MSNINYLKIVRELNFRSVWILRRISLSISLEEYIAILKGYYPHWDMRYGLMYDAQEDYFYAYRSGYVVGKYRVEKQRDGEYLFTEMYENPNKVDCLVIFECIAEACKQNQTLFSIDKMRKWIDETNALNEVRDIVCYSSLGPPSLSDNSFTAKARKLQSIWRVKNGLEMGVGPNSKSVDSKTGLPTYYGNMIKEGKLSGYNFYFPETFAYAQWRCNTKLKEETIDEYRLFNNLMSSMPMAFNLFHPLMMLHSSHPAIIDTIIKHLFPKYPIYRVKEIGLEYIPTPITRYTNDKSAMDAFIRFLDKDGGEYIIAIETKYTDSLGVNKASDSFSKFSFAREADLFTPEGMRQLENNCTQIWRNFLLTEKYRVEHQLKGSYSVILAPKDHPTTEKEIDSIRGFLLDETKIVGFKLEEFIAVLQQHCPNHMYEWLMWFKDRYLDFDEVDKYNEQGCVKR